MAERVYIAEDITETALEDFASDGIEALEELVGKHARFLDYLEDADRP
jgi:hypothetical protein